MEKVAFLFLIYDEINHERLWHDFFQRSDASKFTVYIHYKRERPLTYLEAFKVANPIPTEYADLSLVKAQNLLLREALRDPDNKHFIFVSNSCIPLKRFDIVYEDLFEQNCSFFNLAKEGHIFERGRGLTLKKKYGAANVRKASQWSILHRDIAQILADADDELETLFSSGDQGLPDEYFYISYLFFLKKQHRLRLFDYAVTKCTTFEYWNDKEYKFDGEFTSEHPDNWDRRLKTFYNITSDELAYLLSEPCYFGRKFAKDCTVDGRKPIVEMITAFFDSQQVRTN